MASQRGIRAGRAFVELSLRDKLSRGLKRAQRRLKAFGAGVRQAGLRLIALGAAALVPLGIAIKVFAKAGDELEKMSRRTGIGVEALSELGFAAEQSGADLATVEKGVKTMQRAIVDLGRGLSTQVDAFGALGLTLKDVQNLKPEEQFKIIAERLSKVEDATTRAGVAAQLFGRAGTKLLPVFEDGAAGMEALQAEARRLGLTISTKTAKDAASLTDAFNRVRKVLKVTAITIGAALAPAMEKITAFVTRVVIKANDWIKQNQTLVVTIAKVALGVVGAGVALLALSLALGLVGFAFGGLAAIATVVSGVIGAVVAVLGAVLSPIGLVVGAIGLAIAAFLKFSGVGKIVVDFLKDKFAALSAIVGQTLGGIKDALAAGDIKLAAKVLWNGVKVAFLEGTKEIRKTFSDSLTIIKLTWSNLLAEMLTAWASITSKIKSIWEKVQNFLAKGFTDLFGLFDKSLDTKAAKQQLDAQSKRNLDAIVTQANDALDKIDKNQNDRTSKIINDSIKKMDDRRKALEQAKKDLDAAIAQAKDEKNTANAADAKGKSLSDRIKSLQDQLAGVGTELATTMGKTTVRGTFNALTIRGLDGASAAADRTAVATEQTARNTKRINDTIRTSGLAFA